jgi:DNA helicase-2/ATP-dependent DNA helicase PcrA
VRDEIGLGGAMALLDSSKGGEGSSHLDDLEALEQVASLHPDPVGFEAWLLGRFDVPSVPDGVTLATVHRVKGMEWDAVVVHGASAGILPHRLAEDPEEERRVLHVAITRGRERVDVLADAGRPSPFLAELDGTAPHRPAPAAAAADRPGRPERGTGAARRSGREPLAPPAPGDAGLEEALKAWRRERARKDKVAAFIVFPDRTLRSIATARPATLVALRRIDGIGPTKLEAYGDEVLALVAAHDEGAHGSGDEGSA